jgi:hypothetical protein
MYEPEKERNISKVYTGIDRHSYILDSIILDGDNFVETRESNIPETARFIPLVFSDR